MPLSSSHPAIACQLHEKLGITRPIPAFDLTAACSGLIYALSIAKAYIGMGMSDMSLGRLIFEAESAMVTPGWQFEFWSPVIIVSIITVVLYVVGQNLGDASDPRTHM